ncbi:Fur family transcriptional regulator [Syntrophomonas wolfei]|jgi:Fur family zinc uptake transcriptional regulator/Fur family ferric uptake transcriptional regulator|uniref:Fur family transcriptional regulator n=1 Tax=Syntrophomonas wolfei subsp. wolfei (strain DSM 2245B / Goettingen) TaxID=335541 RepID=Q0AVR4_SYNWW|nr:transcriptional repressor [Syntrophomonas wolfei]ABI69190.1 Fur family transcriptional regulator [Syntrophomonas wolfei subsp. wolfei str. Goettingen G311]
MNSKLQELSNCGFKITPQRRLILDILQKSDRPLTAEETAERIKKKEPRISVATIYRNLNLLVEIEVLSKLEIADAAARFQINQGHNHHLLCLGCGAAIKIGICPLQGRVEELIQEHGFSIDSHYFEITGYCRECQLKEAGE